MIERAETSWKFVVNEQDKYGVSNLGSAELPGLILRH
jgi:hypothetical protein